MTEDMDVKRRVRDFYDAVGWQLVEEGLYQNACYEDLRPVSAEYIRRCHGRVGRHLPPTGQLLLDAGSGPIQYPDYLEYSRGYRYRVCLDISRQALKEARRRIGTHGMYVVADIAYLPFQDQVFDGIVSLHTIHHLPEGDQRQAFEELCRVLRMGGKAVVVYSWGRHSLLMRALKWPIVLAQRVRRVSWRQPATDQDQTHVRAARVSSPRATFTFKHDYRWVRNNLADQPGFDVLVWRSVSTTFLRAFIHRWFFGRGWLRLLFRLEEWAPRLAGRVGQYPMILFSRSE